MHRRGSVSFALVAAFLLSGAGCRKPEFTHRVAVVRFENLSPDGSVEWVGRAASEEIAGQLEGTRHNAIVSFATLEGFAKAMGGRPVTAPGISTERAAAIAAGANRIVSGFYSYRDGILRITALEENTETRKQSPPFEVSGKLDDLLHLTDQVARGIDEEARPPITGSARALRSYALALERPPEQAKPLFEEATQLDPDFGLPYVRLAGMALAARNIEAFGVIFDAVRARSGVRALDRAILNLEDAELHAPASARIDALGALVRLIPADPTRLRELANAELETNRYSEAADHYRKLAALLPSNPEPLNYLGYALMYSGDEAGARKTFADYRTAAPGDANALDSSGDCEFFFNRYAEALKYYEAARSRNAADSIKAGWARLMAGDRSGAILQATKVPSATLQAAQLIRVAGDHARASDLIRNDPAAKAQLAWWQYLDGTGPAPGTGAMRDAIDALLKKDYAQAVPLWRKLAEESPPSEWWTRTVYARVLQETGQKMESARYAQFTPPPQMNRPVSVDELWCSWLIRQRGTTPNQSGEGKR